MRFWTDREDNFLKEKYSEIGPTVCAQELDRSLPAIYQRANLLNLSAPRPCCTVDEGYFNQINTPDKSYILGFMAADGSLMDRPGIGYSLQWGQQARDAQILEDIAKSMKYDGGVKIRQIRKKRKDGSPIKVAYLYIYSQKLVYQLKALKVKELNTMDISDSLLSHWLRGFFDGDGCYSGGFIEFSVNPVYRFNFEKTLQRLQLSVPYFYENKRSKGKIGRYRFTLEQSKLVRELMIRNATLKLNRKWVR